MQKNWLKNLRFFSKSVVQINPQSLCTENKGTNFKKIINLKKSCKYNKWQYNNGKY